MILSIVPKPIDAQGYMVKPMGKPLKNPYPQYGCGFLVGVGVGWASNTEGLPMNFTSYR
jgi:hypothetical protein